MILHNMMEDVGHLSTGNLTVDRALGRIKDVKILGFKSLNGRRYTPEAVRSAAKLYEGVLVNIDHPEGKPTGQRSAYDRFGKLINIRYIEGKGLFGDLEYLTKHPMAPRVTEAAERMPELYGMSHNAEGEGEDDDQGVFVVHKITEVRHVDLVADPATTKSLSESVSSGTGKRFRNGNLKEGSKMDDSTLKDKLMSILTGGEDNDGKVSKLAEMCREAMDAGAPDEEKKTTESACEEGDDKDEDDKEKVAEGEAPDEEKVEKTEEEEEDEPTDEKGKSKMESRSGNTPCGKALRESTNLSRKVEALQLQLDTAKRTEEVRELCESVGLPVSKALIGDLLRIPRDIVERHAKRLAVAAKASKPRSGVPMVESTADKIPTGLSLGNFLTN